MIENGDSDDLKILLQNFEEGFIKPVPFGWENFRNGKGLKI